ncbi:MAG: galactose-1-phosphate uridylyltransferase [Elusimicrobiales bacterium]|nr:galactose-1-phosphate uridylyltransferase [Elusimicrobiales bacterium]MCK5358383.1 galactose-1-phosphate uridylyltransferase [Elusimicrobiales bacterium]
MPEIRRDPVSGRWTIVASTRNERPSDFASGKISESKKNCPFCPGNEDQTPKEIYSVKSSKENNWRLRVVPNKYPALVPSLDAECLESEGLYRKMEGSGVHEVIIETPDHFRQLHEMDEDDISEVFKCFASRIREIKKDKKIKYVMIFKNYGRHAGASLAHPHSQLIAMPMVPMRVANELEGAQTYFSQNSRCVFCDIIREEMAFKKRIIEENDFFIAINPYASRFTFETWILPKKHLSHLEETPEEYLKNLSGVLKATLQKINHSLGETAYNILIHTMPAQEDSSPFYHWHIEIMPKFSHMAGFEWGTGFYINTVSPEKAAEILNSGKKYNK